MENFVKGLYVDTFGLGGDTRVYYDRGGKIHLGKTWYSSPSALELGIPQVLDELRKLEDSGRLKLRPYMNFSFS